MRWTAFGDGLLVHDELRHEVHLLNATGRLVWLACDGQTTTQEAAEVFAEVSDRPTEVLVADILDHVGRLRAAGLVGRTELPEPTPCAAPAAEAHLVARLQVLDDLICIHANDPELVAPVLAPFADLVAPPLASGASCPNIGIHIHQEGFRIYGIGHDQHVGTIPAAVGVLGSLVNTVVRSASTVLALHAGAVRSPAGRVVVLAGASGAGKSTLTAALVRRGWDYLTDEAVGIRTVAAGLEAVGYPKPLALDATSGALLGLDPQPFELVPVTAVRAEARIVGADAGPVAALAVLDPGPIDPGAPATGTDPASALELIAPHAINLTASGDAGLATLARLAHEVPITPLGRGDLVQAVAQVEQLVSGSEG